MTRRLSRLLAQHWIAFALTLAALWLGFSVLLLYTLEDAFIDRRLRELLPAIVDLQAPPPLPPAMRLYPLELAPTDIAAQIASRKPGRVVEFRRNDGRYVHVLHSHDRNGRAFVLVYDVSDQLLVNLGLQRAAPWLFGGALALALCAYAWSALFMRKIARRADGLIELLRDAPDPERLHRYAESEPIVELRELSLGLADAWQQRLLALQREQQTLAFLAHELRTPLQSARSSIALLEEGSDPARSLPRLRRAVARLTRASYAVLWLSSEQDPNARQCAIGEVARLLIDEFRPLAEQRRQVLRAEIADDPQWAGPDEIWEAVIGNLLLNAIQHGGAGEVLLQLDADSLMVRNRRAAESDSASGFGVGLQLVERLCARCGRRCARSAEGDWINCRVEALPGVV